MPPRAQKTAGYVALGAISFSDDQGHVDLVPGDEVPLDRFTEEDIALLIVNGGAKQAA